MSDLIEAFKEYLIINKNVSINTLDSYIFDIKQFEKAVNKDLLSVDTDDFLEFLKGFANSRTQNRKLSSLNSFYKFCMEFEFGDIDINIKSSKTPRNLPNFLDYETIINSVNTIPIKSWIDLRDRAIIIFLYASGVRVSELISLQKEDIYDNWVRVRFAKGQKERYIPIANIAKTYLKEYLDKLNSTSPYLFINYKKTPLSRVSVFKITKKYLNISPHTLRHSYATSLILGGADLRVVQELLGHSSLITTQIYTHIQKNHLKETINLYHPLNKSTY